MFNKLAVLKGQSTSAQEESYLSSDVTLAKKKSGTNVYQAIAIDSSIKLPDIAPWH
jgi:hypothetical protein